MDWIKENKTLAAILGVSGIGAMGLAVLLWLSYSSYSEGLEAYDGAVKKLGRIESAPLYPSKENVTAKGELVQAFKGEVEKLQNTLLNLQPEVKPTSDTEFQAKLKQRMSETRQSAGASGTDAGKIPKNFAFGFDLYTSSLPPAAAANELNDYFDAVHSIVELALDSGVKKIESLTRSDIDLEKSSAAVAPAPAASDSFMDPKGTKSKGKSKAGEATAAPVAKVIERRRVQLNVIGDQPAIQGLLNGLASASKILHFTVVKLLRVENAKLTGPARSAALAKQGAAGADASVAEPSPGAEGTEPPKPAGPEVIEAPKALPSDAVVVMGDEMLHAHLEIDIIKYLK